MPFKVTIAGGITLKDSIESVSSRVETPNDSDAKSNYVGNVLEIVGRVGFGDPTIGLYQWSLLPSDDGQAYRNVEVEVIGEDLKTTRKVTFPNAFVADYSETYSSTSGRGTFSIYLKQKKDKNDVVTVSGI
ncbi:MAG: membrane-associated protease 1 [Bacillota bacterium]|nr:membrane-associated protease 1 [Bacillota bacterium]